MTPAVRLKQRLAQPKPLVCPGCYDALTARLIRRAGFELTLMGGFAVAASRLSVPDIGLLSFTEMLDQLRDICAAVPDLMVIGDGDTGYGSPINVRRTVVEYARAGAAGIMIEDQVAPKKCGHFAGKQVVSREEARLRIRAAVDARAEAGVDVLIMARTDARAELGFDEAMARCAMFADEGVDILFLEAPETEDEMRRFAAGFDRPTMANLVPGGKTPCLDVATLEAMGFNIVNYPLALLSSAIAAMDQHLSFIRENGTLDMGNGVDFDLVKDVVGMPYFESQEQRYRLDKVAAD